MIIWLNVLGQIIKRWPLCVPFGKSAFLGCESQSPASCGQVMIPRARALAWLPHSSWLLGGGGGGAPETMGVN